MTNDELKIQATGKTSQACQLSFVIRNLVNLIYKLFYRIYRSDVRSWYWARRRFTLAGLCVAGGFIVAGAVGTDIENTVTYQTFALLLAILLLAFGSSRFFRGKFSATRSLPRFGTAGQPLHYRVLVKNLTAQPQTGLTLLEDLADPRPPFQEWLAVQLAESRRVRPFRVSERRRDQSVQARECQGGGSPAAVAGRRNGSARRNSRRCGAGFCGSAA